MQLVILLAAFSIFIGVLAFFVGVKQLFEPTERIDERLAEISIGEPKRQKKATGHKSKALDAIANKLKLTPHLEKQLELAYINNYTAGEWLGLQVGAMFASFIIGAIVLHQLSLGIMTALLIYVLLNFYLKRRHASRRKQFQAQLTNVLTMLVSSLRAGYGTIYALKLVTSEMPPPSSQEFKRVVQEITLGYSMIESLEHLVERMASDDLDLVVTAIGIQSEVGGNLAEILSSIAATIEERIRLKQEVKVMTSQQRMSGFVVGGMPVVLGVILTFINPDYMSGLLTPGPARIILVSSITMVIVGFVVIQKVLQVDI